MLDLFAGLNGKIADLDKEIARRAREDARRLMTVPGIGPISATAIAALVPPVENFAKSRDFAQDDRDCAGNARAVRPQGRVEADRGNPKGSARARILDERVRAHGADFGYRFLVRPRTKRAYCFAKQLREGSSPRP